MATESFQKNYEEKAEFNQYWYSSQTIKKIVEEILLIGGKTAFLSTPSLYFCVPEERRGECYLFDVIQG
jgi:hypothetical protein